MIVGFIIVVMGLFLLARAIDPTLNINFNLVWPVILIVIGIYNLLKNKKLDLVTLLLLIVGGWYTLTNFLPGLETLYNIFWPIIFIVVGLYIIFSASNFKKKYFKNKSKDGSILTFNGVFAGVEEKITDEDFKEANIYAIFGGVDLDLRDIKIKGKEIYLNVYSIFGGTTIKLPENHNIIVNSTAILGGNENKSRSAGKKGEKTIYVNCISIFGGTELQ